MVIRQTVGTDLFGQVFPIIMRAATGLQEYFFAVSGVDFIYEVFRDITKEIEAILIPYRAFREITLPVQRYKVKACVYELRYFRVIDG